MHDRPTNVRWLIVLLLMGFAFQGHFNRVGISVAGDEKFIKSGEISATQMGAVYTSFLIVYTAMMVPGGWLIDRIGPRRALTCTGLGLGFCVVLTGALGWFSWPIAALLGPLIAIRGTAGALSAPLHPAAARVVSLWIPLPRRVMANGLVTAGAVLGVAATNPAFGWLMDKLDWPLAFVVSGATYMLFALVWSRLATDTPADHPWINSSERMLTDFPATPPAQFAPLHNLLELVQNRGLVFLTLSYAALSYLQYMFFYWSKYYFANVIKMSVPDSRQAAFEVNMAMAFGMACGGYLTDIFAGLFGRRYGYRTVAIAGMGFSAAFAWAGISTTDANLVVLCFALAFFALGSCEGVFWTTAPLLHKRGGGLAGAFLNFIGNAGGLVSPLITPWIGEEFGWGVAVAVACCICGLGAVFWLWIDPEPARDVAAT
ncbi:MAG: MFS transporter [Planctomycetia bacterium]|nr:MFS transporter [Planctomycetia bacterium]